MLRIIALLYLAGLSITISSPAAVAAQDSASNLNALLRLDRRALSVSWRLNVAAVELCSRTKLGLGWELHALNQYRPSLRPMVEDLFSLVPDRLGVMALVSEGPAHRAGLREDDILISVSGHQITLSDRNVVAADYQAIDMAISHIDNLLKAEGTTSVRIIRAGHPHDFELRPEPHCDWPVQVKPSRSLEAAADGRRISISSELVDFARRDEDLAFIIGHEMAHNLERPRDVGIRLGSRAREEEADRIGLLLANRAGYDTSGADEFMLDLGRRMGPSLSLFGGHPPTRERVEAIRRTQAWIETERRAGPPVRP